MKPELRKALGQVDWIRVVNRLSTIARSIRQDPDLKEDHQVDTERAEKLMSSLEGMARGYGGCQAPAACECLVCLEQQ